MTARIISGFTALIMVLLLLPRAITAAEPVPLENEFVRAVVNSGPDEAGRFSIRTTGGDPSRPTSKDKHLIFGGNTPWTSYTTVLVDGEKYVFGGNTQRRAGQNARYGKIVTGPVLKDQAVVTTVQCGEIEVTQELTRVRGLSTRMLDTVGITYKLTNRGTADHQVGLRVMLDTMCGSNDGAPVRAGSQAITTATILAGKDVPDYWQAFDSLSNPTVVSQGSLRGGALTAPSKILFADWGTLADEPWEPVVAADQGFIRKGETDPDTAVAMFWDPVELEADHPITYLTYYGIGDVSVKPGNLTLGITAPAETTFEHERTQRYTITGYLQNAGGFEGNDVVLTLTLPEGLSLIGGSKLKNTYAHLKPGDTAQESWIVRPNGKPGGKQKLSLAVTSANIEANQTTREIQINVPAQTVTCMPAVAQVPAVTNALPTVIPIQINLTPAEELFGIRYTLKYDPQVIRPLGAPFGISRGRAFVEGGRLLSWEYDDTVEGIITIIGRRTDGKTAALPITQAEANLATVKFIAVGAGKSALHLEGAVAINEKGAELPLQMTSGEVTVVAK